ncbi:MAG TPA: histidinol dehydrogenase, partial [Candidatus Dormibacteraeota bacterium]|nr:histidinol dehydrogenase [Candidatus Dormibacteraeota bacterium]
MAALFGGPITAAAAVAVILDEVRREGDPALVRWTARLDGVDPRPLQVPGAALAAAWEGLGADLQQALTVAHDRITAFHALQRDARWRGSADLGLRPGPVGRAGLYVPGGRAAYPSTVLMTAAPARAAGVAEVVVVTPPGPDGRVAPAVLAAAHLAGVTAVYRVGGAQAIAALAYGTASIPAVDVIAGPGNIFVTLAKQQVVGAVGIDGLAGPSE